MLILHLAALELRRIFLSPLAWTLLAVIQFLIAYMFLGQVDIFLQVQPRLMSIEGAPGLTDIVVAPLLSNAAIVLLLVVPLLTMRLISDEHRARTLSLLFSAPLSMTEIILGKYLGVLAFLLLMLGLIAVMPLALLVGGSLDFGLFFAGFLGLTLLLASFAALGLFMSTLTDQPTVAAISTFGALLLLWILDWAGHIPGNQTSEVFAYLSILRHYEALLKGSFNSADVVYYLLFIAVFLILSIRRLDAERLQA